MPSRSTARATKRVLAIDDDPGVLELIAAILEGQGFEVDTARTSQVALRRARQARYDLVILDLILPDADGIILHGKLKKLSPGIEGRRLESTGTAAGPRT